MNGYNAIIRSLAGLRRRGCKRKDGTGGMAGAWHTHKTALGKGAVERVPGWGPEGLETWKARGDRRSAATTVTMADICGAQTKPHAGPSLI